MGPQDPGQVRGWPGLSPALDLPSVPLCAGDCEDTYCVIFTVSVQEASFRMFLIVFLKEITLNNKEIVR